MTSITEPILIPRSLDCIMAAQEVPKSQVLAGSKHDWLRVCSRQLFAQSSFFIRHNGGSFFCGLHDAFPMELLP